MANCQQRLMSVSASWECWAHRKLEVVNKGHNKKKWRGEGRGLLGVWTRLWAFISNNTSAVLDPRVLPVHVTPSKQNHLRISRRISLQRLIGLDKAFGDPSLGERDLKKMGVRILSFATYNVGGMTSNLCLIWGNGHTLILSTAKSVRPIPGV